MLKLEKHKFRKSKKKKHQTYPNKSPKLATCEILDPDSIKKLSFHPI
jgi:hypothetical protein